MMDDWELISQYIQLVIEASDLPKWGHYEVINADNDFKLTDTHEDSDNEDLRNNLKAMNCNYNNDLYVKELKKKWADFIDAELNKALEDIKMNKMTVGDLIQELEKIPKDKVVKLSVNWDNCDHIQSLTKVYHHDSLEWITLIGG